MPNPGTDEPITKVTLNLFTDDVAWARRYFGQGWSTRIREAIRDYRRRVVTSQPIVRRKI